MATESGFSNQKKLGQSQYKTIGPLGSGRYGAPVTPKGLYDLSGSDQAITDSAISTDEKYIYIEIMTHGASVDDTLRIVDGTLTSWEYNVEEVIDADTLKVLNTAPTIPQIGDHARVLRWITPKYGSDGSLTVSVPTAPAQFIYNGSNQQVIQSTATPANNRAMPNLLFIYKNGVEVPVTKDTVTPSNTLGIPVEIVAASGTPINITAGDLNVQLTDIGVNFDACRIGDGSGNYIGVNATGEASVHDADVKAQLVTLNAKDFATSAKQDTGNTSLSSIDGKFTTLNAKDFATSAKQDTGNTSLSSIDGKFTTLNAKDFATSAKQDTQATLTGAVTEAAPATDTASSGLNGRLQRVSQRLTSLIALLPASLGQKTMANSLAVTLASDQSALATSPAALAGSYAEIVNLTNVAQTFNAPAGAKWAKIQADNTNTDNIRWKIGAAATSTSGMQLEGGRSEDISGVGNISVICETASVNQKVYVQWGA